MKKKTKNQNSDMGTWSRKYFGYTKSGYLHVNGNKRRLTVEDNHIEDED